MIKVFLKKFPLYFYYFLKLSIVLALVMALLRGQWLNAIAIACILILISLPSLIKKRYQVQIPFEFEVVAVLFIYMAVFLGDFNRYYYKFWWWDIYLHLASGFLLGILGFVLVYLLNDSRKVRLNMKAGFVALFALTFSISIGVFWEFFEYIMDSIFMTNMQKSGLPDTILDLLMDATGAFLIASLGYLWMKERINFFIFDNTILKFTRRSQKLSKKRPKKKKTK